MDHLALANSTGDDRVDAILHRVVYDLEIAFPERIQGCYVEGSYADGTGLGTSDVDLVVVFRGKFQDGTERERAIQTIDRIGSAKSVELDSSVLAEAALGNGVYPTLKLGSLCVYGEDARGVWPLLPMDGWIRQRMHAAYWLIVKVFNRPPSVSYPLGYPDPDSKFYGYDQRKVRLFDGREVNSTRDLVRVTGWAATALLALKARQYVARKSDGHRAYRDHIDDEWASLLTDIHDQCRTRWRYLIPEVEDQRRLLRDICTRTLGFENHFLAVYRGFLLSQLTGYDEAGRIDAVRFLEQIPYRDTAIEAALLDVEGQLFKPNSAASTPAATGSGLLRRRAVGR